VEIGTFLLGIFKHTWLPFIVAMVGVIIAVIFLTRYYYSKVAYICPECHEVFKPSMKEFFWAAHTPKTRKLTCSKCGHKGYSIEVYDEG
jgi:DNA-directed RNA polymerase subunit RPC12/RpoP